MNAKSQRFYFEVHFSLYTGKLGGPKSVKRQNSDGGLAKQMREKGFSRIRGVKKMVEALRLCGLDVPKFLVSRSDASARA